MSRITLSIENSPNDNDMDAIRNGLNAFNFAIAGQDNHQTFAIFLRDENEMIVGGLLGETYWGWMYISVLWVEETLRGQGWGWKLLTRAEEEARQRGCKYVHLDTLDFQAPGFYLRAGYSIYGRLNDLPPGHTRFFLWKDLLLSGSSQNVRRVTYPRRAV